MNPFIFLQIVRWTLTPRHFRGLVKDVIRAGLMVGKQCTTIFSDLPDLAES